MRVPFSIILLFLVLAEIAAFILVGDLLGVAATLGLTILAMLAGVFLLRRQGVAMLNWMRAEMAAGRLPARPLAEGAVLALAGLLLILPGFLTDIIGILLFMPPVRSALWRALRRRVEFVSLRRGAARPARGRVVELERDEYALTPRPDTPWRRDESGGR